MVRVFARDMLKSSFQFYRMTLKTQVGVFSNEQFHRNLNPGNGRDRKLESMEYFSYETQKDGNVISESRVPDTVLSDFNFQTCCVIDNPRETIQTNTY